MSADERRSDLSSARGGWSTRKLEIFWIPISPNTVFNTHKEITKYQSLMQNPTMSLEELDEVQQKKALVMISQKLQEAMSLQ